MNKTAKTDSKQMNRYLLHAIAHLRCELEIDAKNEEEVQQKASEWTCYVSGSDRYSGYYDEYCDPVDEAFDIHWEFVDATIQNPEITCIELLAEEDTECASQSMEVRQ